MKSVCQYEGRGKYKAAKLGCKLLNLHGKKLARLPPPFSSIWRPTRLRGFKKVKNTYQLTIATIKDEPRSLTKLPRGWATKELVKMMGVGLAEINCDFLCNLAHLNRWFGPGADNRCHLCICSLSSFHKVAPNH